MFGFVFCIAVEKKDCESSSHSKNHINISKVVMR